MRRVAVALVICFAGVFVSAQRGPARPLEIWVIDVEGGKAALYGGHRPAYWLKVSASPDGSFTITNPRNGFSKTYAKR